MSEATVPAADREHFIRTNAVAIVADLEAKVERQRREIARLECACKSLRDYATRLRGALEAVVATSDQTEDAEVLVTFMRKHAREGLA